MSNWRGCHTRLRGKLHTFSLTYRKITKYRLKFLIQIKEHTELQQFLKKLQAVFTYFHDIRQTFPSTFRRVGIMSGVYKVEYARFKDILGGKMYGPLHDTERTIIVRYHTISVAIIAVKYPI